MLNDNVKNIIISMSNYETLEVPIECFKNIKISETSNPNEVELDACIVDNGIRYIMTSNLYTSPIKRLSMSPSISSITVKYTDGKKIDKNVVWNSKDYSENRYQKTKLINYKEIEISIKESNNTFSINTALKLKSGTTIVDTEGNEYKVSISREFPKVKYLEDTIITDKLLKSKFRIKK